MAKKREFVANTVCNKTGVQRLLTGVIGEHAGLFPAVADVTTKRYKYSYDGTHGVVDAAPFYVELRRTTSQDELYSVTVYGPYFGLQVIARYSQLGNIRKYFPSEQKKGKTQPEQQEILTLPPLNP